MRCPEHCVSFVFKYFSLAYVEVQFCPWFKFYFPSFQTQTQTLEGLIFGGAYLRREICVTVFALFYFVFEGNFPSTTPRGAYIWRGNLTEGFLHNRFGGLIFGGAYIYRGLFLEFYGTSEQKKIEFKPRMKLNHNITYIFLWIVYGNV